METMLKTFITVAAIYVVVCILGLMTVGNHAAQAILKPISAGVLIVGLGVLLFMVWKVKVNR